MFYNLARSFLFSMNPERAHDITVGGLKTLRGTPLMLAVKQSVADNPVEVMGLKFKNPVGLAAGLDKDGECLEAWGAMGFGHAEVGTVTPRPQPGNPQPRLFRLIPAEGIINRMGFNNKGVDYLVEQVKNARYDGIVGINIGKNKDTPVEQGKDDYLICMDKVYNHASYIAVNISSPNTPGLRTLQYGEALDDLLSSLKVRQAALAEQRGKYVPLALKIAPDLNHEELVQIADSLVRNKIDGVIATNTTLEREPVKGQKHAEEAGGLSGRPLTQKSTEIIRALHQELGDKLPIIGVGGVYNSQSAQDKIDAGSKLVQIYSGFIYHGPPLVKQIAEGVKV